MVVVAPFGTVWKTKGAVKTRKLEVVRLELVLWLHVLQNVLLKVLFLHQIGTQSATIKSGFLYKIATSQDFRKF